MSAKESFVLKAIAAGANVSALCREYGISRKTGYKWIGRYRALGLAGLEDVTRRPHTSPLKVSGEVVAEVVRIRKRHPRWSAKKIAEIVANERPDLTAPGQRTVHRILVRTGFLQPGRRVRRRRSNGPKASPRIPVSGPNDLWTVDFKGWWLAMNKERCEPLTIRDAASRFLLEIEVLPSTKQAPVIAVFKAVFRKYGLPKAILTDNGQPFATTSGELGMTQLSAFWTRLGIVHYRTRPGKPCDNGGHERMHRDIADEVEAFRAYSRKDQQEACERFRHDFNCHRPHEALSMRRPADVYERSDVTFPEGLLEPEYPSDWDVRRVQKRGVISYRGRFVHVSWALAGDDVGLEEIRPGVFTVWYFHRELGELVLDGNTPRFVPINWKDNTKVLPKAA